MSNLNSFKKIFIFCVLVNLSFENNCGAGRVAEAGSCFRAHVTRYATDFKRRASVIRGRAGMIMSDLKKKGITFVKTRNYRRWFKVCTALLAAGASVVLATWILNLILVSPHELVSTGQRALLQNKLAKAAQAGNYAALRKIIAHIKTYYLVPWMLLLNLVKYPELRDIYKHTSDIPYELLRQSKEEIAATLLKRGDLKKMIPVLKKLQKYAQKIGPQYGYNLGDGSEDPVKFFVVLLLFLRKTSVPDSGTIPSVPDWL